MKVSSFSFFFPNCPSSLHSKEIHTDFVRPTDLAKRSPEAAKNKNVWCYRPGEACYKVRRAAMALVGAVAEKEL